MVAATQQEYGEQIRFVGVSVSAQPTDIVGFIDQTGITAFPHVIDTPQETIALAYNIPFPPAFAFVHPDGTYSLHIGALRGEELNARLDLLLAGENQSSLGSSSPPREP